MGRKIGIVKDLGRQAAARAPGWQGTRICGLQGSNSTASIGTCQDSCPPHSTTEPSPLQAYHNPQQPTKHGMLLPAPLSNSQSKCFHKASGLPSPAPTQGWAPVLSARISRALLPPWGWEPQTSNRDSQADGLLLSLPCSVQIC